MDKLKIPNLRIKTIRIKPYLQSVQPRLDMQNEDSEQQGH